MSMPHQCRCGICGQTMDPMILQTELSNGTGRPPAQQEVPPMDSHSVTCAKCSKTLTVRWSVGDEVSILGIICPCGHRTATNQATQQGAPKFEQRLVHEYGQDGKYVWRQGCQCERCREETRRIAAEQERHPVNQS